MSANLNPVPMSKPPQGAHERVEQLRKLFSDAPQLGKTALENVLRELTSQAVRDAAAAGGECGPRRQPSGQGL